MFNWAHSEICTLINIQQFGNAKNTPTTHYLVSVLHLIYRDLEKRKTSLVLSFIDCKKAFSLINVTIFIKIVI